MMLLGDGVVVVVAEVSVEEAGDARCRIEGLVRYQSVRLATLWRRREACALVVPLLRSKSSWHGRL